MKRKNPLAAAIEKAGGQAALARMLGVKQQTVFGWLHHSRQVPAERVLAVERVTGVPRHELRPDIYPREESRGAA